MASAAGDTSWGYHTRCRVCRPRSPLWLRVLPPPPQDSFLGGLQYTFGATVFLYLKFQGSNIFGLGGAKLRAGKRAPEGEVHFGGTPT